MKRTRLQNLLEYGAVCVCAGCIRILPPRISLAIGRGASRMALRLLPARIQLARENLIRAFGTGCAAARQQQIIHQLLALLGEAVSESSIARPEYVRRNVAITGAQHLAAARRNGTGIMALVPHFGMWELASYAFGVHFPDGAVIYKPMKNPYIDRMIRQAREQSGLTLIPSRNALRPIMSKLKQQKAVGMLFDQNAGKSGIKATFFGKTAFTYAAPATFALKTGCSVLPAYLEPLPQFRRYRLVVEEPFPLIRTGDQDHDLLANTQQYNDWLEQLVRARPELWFGWLHQRWKIPSTAANDPSIIR